MSLLLGLYLNPVHSNPAQSLIWIGSVATLNTLSFPGLTRVPHWQCNWACPNRILFSLSHYDLLRGEECNKSQFFQRVLAGISAKMLYDFRNTQEPHIEFVSFVEEYKGKFKYMERHTIFLFWVGRLKIDKNILSKLIHIHYSFCLKSIYKTRMYSLKR